MPTPANRPWRLGWLLVSLSLRRLRKALNLSRNANCTSVCTRSKGISWPKFHNVSVLVCLLCTGTAEKTLKKLYQLLHPCPGRRDTMLVEHVACAQRQTVLVLTVDGVHEFLRQDA